MGTGMVSKCDEGVRAGDEGRLRGVFGWLGGMKGGGWKIGGGGGGGGGGLCPMEVFPLARGGLRRGSTRGLSAVCFYCIVLPNCLS